MKILAHAKINLDLHILGKRPDGYHELSTIMQGLALADEIEVSLTEPDGETGTPGGTGGAIELTVDGTDLPADETNLAWRAAALMQKEAEKRFPGRSVPGVRIALTKHVPMAAGLGGGSSDAAAVMLALNELLGMELPLELLFSIGKRLGADVPFCLLVDAEESAAAHCTGIGDFLEPVPADVRTCLLVKPALDIPTPAMYKAWDEMQTVAANDFEPIAEYLYPEVRAAKDAIRNASSNTDAPLYIQMSGSGPTVFALYETREAGEAVRAALDGAFPTVILTETLG